MPSGSGTAPAPPPQRTFSAPVTVGRGPTVLIGGKPAAVARLLGVQHAAARRHRRRLVRAARRVRSAGSSTGSATVLIGGKQAAATTSSQEPLLPAVHAGHARAGRANRPDRLDGQRTSSAPAGPSRSSWTRRAAFALVTDEQEVEQAIRLILGTAYGERPMRPEFGCAHPRLRVRGGERRDRRARSSTRCARRSAAGSRAIDARRVLVTIDETDRSLLYIDIRYHIHEHQRPAQPRLPFYTIPAER